jgi:DNA-binding transcriptional LysR family regulator
VLTQYLCATRSYLDEFGRPTHPRELSRHQAIVMPSASGRPHPWRLVSNGDREMVEPGARVLVNDALTICALVHHGAGIGAISAYLCGDGILDGRLERVLPDWSLAPLPVSLIFPSKRKISPAVRAFVDYMREANAIDASWLRDPLATARIEIHAR